MKLFAITATGYSGNTMLSLMLSRYPESVSCSELGSLIPFGSRPLKCKSHGDACSVWTREMADSLSNMKPSASPHATISEISGAKYVIDASKKLSWYRRMLPKLRKEDVVCIFLNKSPAEYVASQIPRFKGDTTIGDTALMWGKQSLQTSIWRKRAKYDKTGVSVKYNDLASEPERVLRTILAKADLPYVEGQERFWEREQHPLAGNLEVIYTAINQPGSRPQHIKPDERWRDLPPQVIHEVYSTFLVQVSRRILEYPDLRSSPPRFSIADAAAVVLARTLPRLPLLVTTVVCQSAVAVQFTRKYGFRYTAKKVVSTLSSRT